MCNLLIYGVIFSLFLEEGLSIKCYTCNSYYVKSCENLKSLPDEELMKYETNCDLTEAARKFNLTMCRIINQKINDETRVIRQCASGGRDGECHTKTGTSKIKMEYCECSTDLCNSARSYKANGFTSFSLLLPITFFLTACSA